MADAPSGSDLMDIVELALRERVLPHVGGDARYTLLMAMRAVRMAAREAEQEPLLETADAELAALAADVAGAGTARALCAAIRNGGLDGDARLHHALWARAAVAASISRPSHLSRMERRIAQLPDPDDT